MKKLFYIFTTITLLMIHFPVKAENDSLSLNSESAIMIDAKTKEILYEKNINEKMFPASITKIATGIMAIESGKLDEIATVSKRARWAEGTRIYLEQNEQKSIRDLTYGLLMNSGNDAAITIAEHLGGSVENFAVQMNEFVKKIIPNPTTNFKNPHGLHDPEHVTSAYEMAMIAQYAMKNDLFREIVSTQKRPWDGDTWKSNLVNQNKLLWRYEGTTGIKNGFTDEALNTLVTSAKRGDTEFIVVLMRAHGSEKIYADAVKLFDYGFEKYETKQIMNKNQEVAANGSTPFISPDDIYVTVEKNVPFDYQVNNEGKITIQKGDTIQILDIKLQKKIEAPKKEIKKNNDVLDSVLMILKIIGWIILSILLSVITLFLLFIIIKTNRKKKKKKEKSKPIIEKMNQPTFNELDEFDDII